eukprot:TRINITY_DN2369_c0_g2_i1.p1 TRINITY_DN2369_c0_g2~~TRINITY_DN2369_c0_g2_i1.p1  ORF type:complete len:435 (-),score=135.10 TRINITY_DN2369_c0_g2_i1:25-1329(-)
MESTRFRAVWAGLVKSAVDRMEDFPLTRQWNRSELLDPDFLKGIEADIYEPVRLMYEGCDRMNAAAVKEFEKAVIAKIQVKMLVARESAVCTKELGTVTIARPVFVIGPPRFGTTLLHNLLSCDSRCRSLKLWELLFPGRLALLREDRLKLAQERSARFGKLCAGFKALHLYDPVGPDDCNWSLDNNFVDFAMSCSLPRLDAYRKWLLANRHEGAYKFHRTVMQIAQLDSPAQGVTHFAMKASAHLFWLNDLLEVFPDARIVWMHRDPVEALPSICKMHELIWNFYPGETGTGDKKWLGAHLMEWMATEIERGLQYRAEFVKRTGSSQQFYDVNFSDLVMDPQGTVYRLYEHFGMEFPFDMEQKIQHWIQENPRDKYGHNTYTAAEFGLDEDVMRARFKSYIDNVYHRLAPPPASPRSPLRLHTTTPVQEGFGF